MEDKDRLARLRQATIYTISEPTDDKTDLDILEQLHTDVISRAQFKWAQSFEETRDCLQRKQRAIADAHRRGMLFIGGVTVSAMYLENGQGTHLLDLDELAAMATRSPANELVELSGRYYHGCINNPAYFEYVKKYVHIIVDGGVDGLHFDEADSRWFHHRPYECFCDHCNKGLRNRLKKRYTAHELVERFGIDDVDTFNYRAYLAAGGWSECPGQSPLHHEWWLYQLEACRDKFIELVADSQSYAQERYGHTLVNTANVYDPLWLPERCLESPHIEYVMIGSCLELRLRNQGEPVHRERLPPQYSYAPLHLASRSCTPDRPVTFFIDWPSGAVFMDAQTPRAQRDILKYLFAESYACGVYFHAPYKSCYARWTGPLDMLTQYTRFFAEQRACFADVRPVAPVGLLYSYASSIWDHFPMELAPSPSEPIHALQYYGVGQALLDAGIGFDGVFVGDGNIMEDRLNAEQLAGYETVILPYWYSVSPSQVETLAAYATQGGKVLVIGDWAAIDIERTPLNSATMRAKLSDAGAVFLDKVGGIDFEAYLVTPDTGLRRTLAEALESLSGRTLRCDSGGANLEVLLTQAADGSQLHVHVLNRELTAHGYLCQGNVALSISLPRGIEPESQRARLVSPDMAHPTLVDVTRDGNRISFILPEIEVYALLTLSC